MSSDYPTSVRLPQEVRDEIKKIAKKRGVSPSQIIIEACIQYLENSIPGLCPKCHTQNNPDAEYCQKCITPLSEEAKAKFRSAEEYIENTPEVKQLMMQILEKLQSQRKRSDDPET